MHRLTSQENLQGLLRSAVGGLQQVMRRGEFALPQSVISATHKFKMEADPLRGFLQERVASHHPNNPHWVPRTDVYNAYTTWSAQNGFHQMSAQRFYESFMAAAVDTFDNPVGEMGRNGVRGIKGISLR